MTKIKPMLTAVAVLALMLLAGAGSAAFAAQPSATTAGVKGPSSAQLGPQQQPPPPKQGITGGVGFPNGKYPFIAALFDMKRGESASNQFFCGGTLIDSDSVLTAAHCLYYPDKYRDGTPYPKAGQIVPRTDLRVVVGGTQLTEQSIPNAGVKGPPQGQLGPQSPPNAGVKGPPQGQLGPQQPCTPTAAIKCPPQGQLGPPSSTQGQVRAVSRVSIPGSWDPANIGLGWDVAVLKLTSPVTGITPVKLPLSTDNGYEQPGTLLTIAGWGSAMKGGAGSDRMQEAKVPVVSDADVAKLYTSFVPELMMAAGEKGTGICKGDSGGPLFRIPKTLGGAKPIAPYQYGITSFNGDTCGGTPGAFTEVNAPAIREFIVSSMNK